MGRRKTKITLDFFKKISKKKSLDSLATKSIFFKAEKTHPIFHFIKFLFFFSL